ncbi:MAG: DUF4129 domain-containing protein [Chloroflexota bacterium]
MRSLRSILLVLFLARLLLPGGAALAAQREGLLSLFEYWQLVEHTRQVVAGLQTMPEDAIRPALDELAAEWQAVNQVRLDDGALLTVDNSHLVQALQNGDKADLEGIKTMLETLLEAHSRYPSSLFTSADLKPLQAILVDPQFQRSEPPENPIAKWFDEQWQRFMRWLAGIFGEDNQVTVTVSEGAFEVIPSLATILLVLALAYVFRSLFFDLAAEASLAGGDEEGGEPITAEQAFARAQSLSRGGDYRSAVRYLYLSSLLLLDERGMLRYDRSKTNHEYLRSVAGQPELAEPLREVVDVFDNVWYGYHSVDEESFQHYSRRVEELKEKKPQ